MFLHFLRLLGIPMVQPPLEYSCLSGYRAINFISYYCLLLFLNDIFVLDVFVLQVQFVIQYIQIKSSEFNKQIKQVNMILNIRIAFVM
jgi:hypothetical protein